MSGARLFDDAPRTLGLRVKHAVSHWHFLNLSRTRDVGTVREELERWFARYPASGQSVLARRFRTESDGDTHAPFLELFLHELCCRLCCTLEPHPRVPGTEKTPDFRVVAPDGSAFYLEAAVAYELSDADRAAEARVRVAFDSLNRLRDTRVFLAVSYEGDPGTPPPVARFRSEIERELAKLTDEELCAGAQDAGPDRPVKAWHFEHDGWVVDVEAFPRSASRVGDVEVRPVAVTAGDVRWVRISEAIRDTLVKKATRYGELDLPYVVAVSPRTRHGFAAGHDEALEALFGSEATEFRMAPTGIPAGHRPVRQPDGTWVGRRGPRNTRLSACLIIDNLAAWSVPRAHATLFHNPWSTRRFESVLCQLPQCLPDGGRLVRVEGRSMVDVFGLPLDWPGQRMEIEET